MDVRYFYSVESEPVGWVKYFKTEAEAYKFFDKTVQSFSALYEDFSLEMGVKSTEVILKSVCVKSKKYPDMYKFLNIKRCEFTDF